MEVWCQLLLTECLKTYWKFYDIIWPLWSNTHADPRLYGKWSKKCQGATQEKCVLKTWNTLSSNLSCLKIFMVPSDRISQTVCFKKSKSNYFVKKILLEKKTKFDHNACHFNSVRWLMLALKNFGKHQWQSNFRDYGCWM